MAKFRIKNLFKFNHFLIFSGVVLLLTVFLVIFENFHLPFARGGQDANVRGWFWSENIGWVSANCFNDYNNDGSWENCCSGGTTCPPGVTQSNTDYGLEYNTSDKTLSGWAWGENIGWICFGGSCSGTAPDGYSPWACVGKRMPDGSCFGDCQEEFNVPGQFSCTTEDGTEDLSLIAHWKFNDGTGTTAKDSSPNEHTGTLQPADSGPVWYTGKWSGGLKFDGLDDYVSVSGSFSDITQTQEVWVRILDTPSSEYRITSRSACGNGRLLINSQRKVVWEFGDSTTCDSVVSDTSLEVGKWYHLGVTFDNSTNLAKIYINGVLDKSKTLSIEPIVSSTLTIGSHGGISCFLNGVLDNLAIYNRVKTDEEIWDDAHSEISGWAKVEALGDKGWLRLKGQTTDGIWYGYSLDSWAGSYYTFTGYAWNANENSGEGIGWLKGGYYYSGVPIDADNFSVSTSAAYCYSDNGVDKTQAFLSWSPAPWTETYNIYRCDNVESCPGCAYSLIDVVFPEQCGQAECSYQDSGLDEATGYCWKVVASNSQSQTQVEITPSPQWARTTLCAPATSLDSSVCGIIKISLDEESLAVGHNIYRSLTPNGCVVGDPSDDSASDIRSKVNQGTCFVIGHLGEALDYRDIVGHWLMNETGWNGSYGEVVDSSGKGNHATAKCVGDSCQVPSTADGLFSKAGSFDGSDDYLDCGNDVTLNMTDKITVEAWVYGTFDSNYPEIVSKRDYVDNQNDGWWLALSGTNLIWGIGFDDENNTAKEIYFDGLRPNEWNHVAGVFDGTQMIAYINGEPSPPLTNLPSSHIDVSAQPVTIGRRASGTQHFAGLIDNVAIYHRAKTAEEIKLDYEAGRCFEGENCSITQACSSVDCGDLEEVCNVNNCGEENTCCYIDRRIIPKLNYYYRVTSLTRQSGESPPSTPLLGSTLCYPPTEIRER